MTDQGTEDGLTIDGVQILPGQWWRSRSPRLPFTVRIRDVVEDRIYYVTSPVPPEEGEESTIPSMMYADAFKRNYQFDPLLDKALRRAEEAEHERGQLRGKLDVALERLVAREKERDAERARAEDAETALKEQPEESSDEVWRVMKMRFRLALAREWAKDEERRRGR